MHVPRRGAVFACHKWWVCSVLPRLTIRAWHKGLKPPRTANMTHICFVITCSGAQLLSVLVFWLNCWKKRMQVWQVCARDLPPATA